jgi:tRNA A37 threonylcarbamoyltransferase TsaD
VTLVLALDTATDIATACVAVDGAVLAEGALGPERYAAQRILELADELLAEAGTRLDELDAVVVGTGPGRSPACASGSPPPAGSAWPSACRWPASRRSTRCAPGPARTATR